MSRDLHLVRLHEGERPFVIVNARLNALVGRLTGVIAGVTGFRAESWTLSQIASFELFAGGMDEAVALNRENGVMVDAEAVNSENGTEDVSRVLAVDQMRPGLRCVVQLPGGSDVRVTVLEVIGRGDTTLVAVRARGTGETFALNFRRVVFRRAES